MGFSVETKTYSAMLYALADELRKASPAHPVLASPEPLEEAAERLDMLTVTIRGLVIQRDELLASLDAFISEHEECEDSDGWMAFMCSPEAFHVASEAADSVKAATCGEPGKPAKTECSGGSPA